jgi:DNA-directed RNA polymerase III subunit RPC3
LKQKKIQKQIRLNEQRIEANIIDKYLTVLVQDSFNCIDKVGDFGGGAYSVDIRKAITNLCKAHIESYVREKYGSRCLRIFKIVMEKIQIEQQQVNNSVHSH